MDGVVDLPLEPGRERKAHVLLAASELYVARGYHDAGEERIYEELFRQLLPETPTSQRLAIARLLAAYDHPPECCLEELAADADETVAAAALSGTAPLGEATLIAAVGRGPERVRTAIATRPGLAAPVRLALARHAAPSTLKRMLALAPVGPDDDILDVLFTRPEVLGELAVPLARHHVLPASLLFALFLDLDEAGRMEALAAAETRRSPIWHGAEIRAFSMRRSSRRCSGILSMRRFPAGRLPLPPISPTRSIWTGKPRRASSRTGAARR